MPAVIAAVLVAGGLLSTGMAADDALPGVEGRALDDRPGSRIEGNQAMDGAVAASVVGAISNQFGERTVAVKLDRVVVQPASVRDRNVSGSGRVRIDDDPDWIPFRFDVLFDTRTVTATRPAIILGDRPATHAVALDSPVARAIGRRASAALREEFAQQPVRLAIDRVTTADAGTRYLRVEASGTVDFASEGSTAAQVQALYDRETGEWVRMDYELGITANRPDTDTAAVAIR